MCLYFSPGRGIRFGGNNDMAQCSFCFRDKHPLQPVLPKVKAEICKACDYQVQKVIGFLRYYGVGFTITDELSYASLSKPEDKRGKRNLGEKQPDTKS